MTNPRASLRRLGSGIARWAIPGALLILFPKCLGCVVAYAAIAAGLGLGGREICGGGLSHPSASSLWLFGTLSVASLAGIVARRNNRGRRFAGLLPANWPKKNRIEAGFGTLERFQKNMAGGPVVGGAPGQRPGLQCGRCFNGGGKDVG